MRLSSVIVVMIIGLALIAVVGWVLSNNSEPVIQDDSGDLSRHPVYINYDFSDNSSVIDFGIQPLWTPSSVILEVMKRDKILVQELHDLGYSLRFHSFLKGNDINFFFKTGDLEVGVGGDMPALRLASSHDVRIVSVVQEGPISIISNNIREIKDLKNKEIAYAFGSNAHFYLLHTLQKNGLTLSDVNLIPMDVPLMTEAVHSGEIDAFAAWEPTPKLAITKYPELTVTHRGKSYGFLYLDNELFEKNPNIVYSILSSEIRAIHWLRQNEKNIERASEWVNEASLELSSEYSNLDPSMIISLVKEDLPGIRLKEYPRIPAEIMSEEGFIYTEYEFLRNLELLDGSSSWETVSSRFDLEILETVISDPNNYSFSMDLVLMEEGGN